MGAWRIAAEKSIDAAIYHTRHQAVAFAACSKAKEMLFYRAVSVSSFVRTKMRMPPLLRF